MGRYCAVNGCLKNKKRNADRRFFGFPTDEARCRQWIRAIGRPDLESKSVNVLHSSYCVCDLHFTDSDIQGRYLKYDASPKYLLPHMEGTLSSSESESEDSWGLTKAIQTDLPIEICTVATKSTQIDIELPCKSCKLQKSTQDCWTQTSDVLSAETPRKRKIELDLQPKGKKCRSLESSIENAQTAKESNTPALLAKIIKTQNTLWTGAKGNKYDQEYMMFAMNVYFASPVAYRLFPRILSMPDIKTLQRRLAFEMSTKFDDNVIKCLESKLRNLSESEKYCVICADEISLKRHLYYQINKDKVVGFHEINDKQTKDIANQAFVVMARGIFSNWKQPLAFCLFSQNKNYEDLCTWLENIIAQTIQIGFNVLAFTSNQDSSFINMAIKKSISADQPFFYINGKKIYYIFDVPNVIKSMRNNLIKYDFVYSDQENSKQVASWSDIKMMYDVEKNKTYKIAYKLTESHINPNNFEKKRVKLATQVLSRTVAATICFLVETGKLPEESIGTSKFIELINDTFDVLNSSTVNDDYIYKKAFHHADYQINRLEQAKKVLTGLRVTKNNGQDVTNQMEFIKGLLISISAILGLTADLKKERFKYLFTRRLNQDPLENYLKVRPKSGNCREPTAIKFMAAYKKLFISNNIRNSDYANCSEDLDQLLRKVEEAQNSFMSRESVTCDNSEKVLRVGTVDYRFDLPEENTITYVCGYLLKKCNDHHKDCEILQNYLKRNGKVDEKNVFTNFKGYTSKHPFGGFINPPEDFTQYVREMDNICVDYIAKSEFYHIGNEIMIGINKIPFKVPCPCFPIEYLKKLFVRFRIFNLLRKNNKNFKDKTFRGKLLSVSHL